MSLSAWTSLVDFLALAASLWLGIYVITRSARSRPSWLAGLTLWSLSGYFLDSFLHLNPPQESALSWWTGWTILFSAPLWLHLTQLLLSRGAWWQRLSVWTGYVLALALLLVEQTTRSVFGVWTGKPFVYASAQRPGSLYPLVCLLLIGCPILALLNLYQGWRESTQLALRRQLKVLTSATALAAMAGAYLTLSVWFRLRVPLLPGQAALGVALALLGYGVARYNALIEGHASRVDFAYSLLAIVLVVSLYSSVTYLSYLIFDISFAVFIFVLMWVILSHSLYEWGRTTLERLFYRRQYRRLRANLRAFAHEAGDRDLSNQPSALLGALCRSLDCTWGWILLREEGDLAVAATYPEGQGPRPVAGLIPADARLPEEIAPLRVPARDGVAQDDAILVPLFVRGEQIGVIVLGERTGGRGHGYSEGELDVLDALADQVASILYVVRQQDKTLRQIDALVGTFREREQALQAELHSVLVSGKRVGLTRVPEGEMRPLVEDALRHLYDYAYLGEHELAQMHVVSERLGAREGVLTHLDRGRALSQVLVDVVEKLRPPGPQPKEPAREWVQYIILHDAYVLGELNRDIMSKLYISESSFNRARRRAVRGVARAVEELERAARARAS